MKKLAVAAATALALVLGACGTQQGASSSATSSATSATSAATSEATSATTGETTSSASSAASTETASSSASSDVKANEDEYFAHWTADSPTVTTIKAYVEDVTDPNSKNFIPVEDRIVTADFDGTLYGELDPIYFDWAIVIHRILWDSTFEPTPEQIEVAHTIEEIEKTRKFPEHYDVTHASTLAKVFGGMTPDEITKYAQEFAETPAPKFNNLLRKDAYYVPMQELVRYLEANDFTVFVVSGTDRSLLRAIVPYGFPEIPSDRTIGSPATWVASGENPDEALAHELTSYQLTADDKVISSGNLEYKNLKMNKVSTIQQEIGKQPVISLGNSSGDTSMANYAVNNNKYKSLAFMLCCDDTERDWGEVDKAEKMKTSCEENGWNAISQKNEWTTFFGDDVTIDKSWTWSSEQAGPNAREEAVDAQQELAAAA